MGNKIIVFLSIAMMFLFVSCSKENKESNYDVTEAFTDDGFKAYMLDEVIYTSHQYEDNNGELIISYGNISGKKIDANGDGRLTKKECETVIYIGVTCIPYTLYPVYNLNGIEYCKNLMSLSVSNNNLTGTLDLSLLANCKNLRHIDVSNNNLTGTLDLSSLANCKNLMYIDVSNNNLTGTLDFTMFKGCGILKEIDISHNNFTGLQGLSSLVSCKNLVLSNNNLTGILDFSSLEKLQYLTVHGSMGITGIIVKKGVYVYIENSGIEYDDVIFVD